MKRWLSVFIQQCALQPKKVFLFDALGALATSLLLLLMVAPLESFFQMPAAIVHWLSAFAALFFVYSLGCWFFNPRKWKPYLITIIIANGLYCCLTLGLVLYHVNSLAVWGIAYFLGEIAVIVVLMAIEVNVLRSEQKGH
jgi:hypothetical protein